MAGEWPPRHLGRGSRDAGSFAPRRGARTDRTRHLLSQAIRRAARRRRLFGALSRVRLPTLSGGTRRPRSQRGHRDRNGLSDDRGAARPEDGSLRRLRVNRRDRPRRDGGRVPRPRRRPRSHRGLEDDPRRRVRRPRRGQAVPPGSGSRGHARPSEHRLDLRGWRAERAALLRDAAGRGAARWRRG